MILAFLDDGNLPPGIHWTDREEFEQRFGWNGRRREMLEGLRQAIGALRSAGCATLFVDGSFVTAKDEPGDYDACWDVVGADADLLDEVFFDFSNKRAAQKARYRGEFFLAQGTEGMSGRTFLEFFQTDRETGAPKGIVGLELLKWQP